MGPLAGLRIVEVAGIGPGPFAAMMLADMGADVLRVDRLSAVADAAAVKRRPNVITRGRRSVAVDLKHPAGIGVLLKLAATADALIEGFRPGVAERLGFGPDVCRELNPRLVYGRVTGWGQDGDYARWAGHDINYIALAGALEPVGRAGGAPVPPLNLVGDYAGGGMFLAFGVVCGILEARGSGCGQVVDAAIVDGAAVLTTAIHGLRAMGLWTDERGTNMLDSGAPWYDVYETADSKFISVGAIEPQFYARLLDQIGLADDPAFASQEDRQLWPRQRARLGTVFATKTRQEWCSQLEPADACFAPVLSLDEAPDHPHLRRRGTFVTVDGVTQPAPAPRFSRTAPEIRGGPPLPGEHTEAALAAWGFDPAAVAEWRRAGAIA